MWIRSWWTKRRGWQKFLLLLLAALVIYEIPKIKYYPWRNFQPQYSVTIKGHVDPKIAGVVKLKWIANYSSSVPECDVMYNWFSGNIGPRSRVISFSPIIQPSGDYEVKIPIDYFKPGYCHWEIYYINESTNLYQPDSDDNSATFLWFYPCGYSSGCEISHINPITPAEAAYETNAGMDFIYQFNTKHILELQDTDNITSFNDRNIIPRNDSYVYTKNIFLKQESANVNNTRIRPNR